jgi:hypothetical protein
MRDLVNSANFRAVFFDTKQKTDEMLFTHNNVDFLKNPAVDVDAISTENGIIEISPVPKTEIPERHATLKDGVIHLNDEDSREEQRFSTGHELAHHIKEKADEEKKENERRLRELMRAFFKDVEVTNTLYKQSEKRVKSVIREAARAGYDKVVQELKTIPYFTEIAKSITEKASEHFGKRIPEDKAYNSIAKLIRMENEWNEGLIPNAVEDLYNEEIADYFSANLLVPLERFVLWEDRPDDEIAAAFQVPVACIIKRREEVALELEYLAE